MDNSIGNERMETLRTGSVAPLLIDNSLSILNRTGAYYIAKDLCQEFVPEYARVRYWRLRSRPPEGLIRKIVARMMMLEINWLKDSEFCLIDNRDGDRSIRVFFDPLYVMRSVLTESDIVLCHDVGPLTHSKLYDSSTAENYRIAYEKIRRQRPGVVFVSEWSKRNFTSLYGSDFRFLKTIPLYVRTELFDGPMEAISGVDGPFFLTVGAFETRKNQMAALKAYRDGGFHALGVKYVLCGPRGDGHKQIIEFARTIPGVVVLGYVPDSRLRWLYAHAEAFLLPSLLEGFGMPALEAAYMGLLPIISEQSALVEAVSGVCVEVPPEDPQAISRALRSALFRSSQEKENTGSLLRELASRATKQRFLSQWKDLLLRPSEAPVRSPHPGPLRLSRA
ncbi:glycosyltransferase involved in cell wall biosynthesis [Sinorhizobium kostiense]|uniref:Glycosyltransferase involved in cell wall biosynthesis n=1 Tax=Sinorhizobium kostiense TaxID=76747 RepID=A0ABS4QYL1_9HYPH|nr:glycosyltransferase [Sinorhizobium kostiense]MBP2234662.1 glycosyltransferase involved in cell wall biosynthesis [Sinorhizobium kostiense]